MKRYLVILRFYNITDQIMIDQILNTIPIFGNGMKVFLAIIMMFIVIGSALQASAEEFTYNEKVSYEVESQKVTVSHDCNIR